MDLRSQLRLEADEPVHVTVLGECETTLLGRITNYSANGMAMEIDAKVSIGTAVKVEWSNTLLLGEVCYCRPAGRDFPSACGWSTPSTIRQNLRGWQSGCLTNRLRRKCPRSKSKNASNPGCGILAVACPNGR